MADGWQPGSPGLRCIVIPARFGSTRFPGKPLARLRGANGVERTLIEWTWRAAAAVPGESHILVATDDLRIADEVERFGGRFVMTPPECSNGTERCAAVIDELPEDVDVIVNLQGDALLTPPSVVTALFERMTAEPDLAVATPALPCTGATLDHLLAEQRCGRVGGTTVLFDRAANALYFSKFVLPHGADRRQDVPVYLHLGVYAYRREALSRYRHAPPSTAELSEGLEQLRFLDQGVPVAIVVVPPPEGLIAELNNPEDVMAIEAELRRRELA
jgi:3-deoxy-manno-octulosonate cytidylyltransferase (CMP-KDO synthetase)